MYVWEHICLFIWYATCHCTHTIHHITVAWQHTPVDAGLAHPFGYMLTQRPLVCVVVVYHPHPHSVLGVLVCVCGETQPTAPSGGDSCDQFTEGHISSLLYCSHYLVCGRRICYTVAAVSVHPAPQGQPHLPLLSLHLLLAVAVANLFLLVLLNSNSLLAALLLYTYTGCGWSQPCTYMGIGAFLA